MSTAAAAHTEEDHGHHHKETFVTKYIFSQDHKMISKQYLITGLFMGIIGIAMSLLFRLQLNVLNTKIIQEIKWNGLLLMTEQIKLKI